VGGGLCFHGCNSKRKKPHLPSGGQPQPLVVLPVHLLLAEDLSHQDGVAAGKTLQVQAAGRRNAWSRDASTFSPPVY